MSFLRMGNLLTLGPPAVWMASTSAAMTTGTAPSPIPLGSVASEEAMWTSIEGVSFRRRIG